VRIDEADIIASVRLVTHLVPITIALTSTNVVTLLVFADRTAAARTPLAPIVVYVGKVSKILEKHPVLVK